MRSMLIGAVAAISLLAAPSAANAAYEGGWYFDNNPGGWEILALGDNSDDTYRILRGTDRFCGRRGASYATMRSIINGNSGEQITWWVADTCDDGYVRVCVQNWRGRSACSTYWDDGWE